MRIEPRREALRHDGDQLAGGLQGDALDAGLAMDAEAELAIVSAEALLMRLPRDRAGGERDAERNDILGRRAGRRGNRCQVMPGFR